MFRAMFCERWRFTPTAVWPSERLPWPTIVSCLAICLLTGSAHADPPKPITSLDNRSVKFTVSDKSFVVLKAGQVTAAVVNNDAVNEGKLKGHRAGYSGIGYLSHAAQPRNVFVPTYAGLNFEHIHDGTVQERRVLFEPRNASMQLRLVDDRTAELFQSSTPHFGLASCHRYRLLDDGTIEMTFECIPRRQTFKHNYIGLFWASYIDQPESLDIFFRGTEDGSATIDWRRGVTPRHGVDSTHIGLGDRRRFDHVADFPLTLVFNRSKYRFAAPWYYGVSHGMALVYIFRPSDQVRLTQSPSGGGRGNPAWDFQYFISDYQMHQRYQFVMRAMYVPFKSREQIVQISRRHRLALGHDPDE